MTDQITEQEIVRGLRVGDRDAWDALCRQFGARVWKYTARLVGSDGEAVADVFQETMLAAAGSGRRLFAEGTRLWAWLARIAHNQAALYWRKVYRQGVGQAVDDLTDPRSGDPVEALSQQETVHAVRRMLADMPADYAALLVAKYLDGMSVEEIVEQQGGTTEGVRSKLARARRDFRSRFRQIEQSPKSKS